MKRFGIIWLVAAAAVAWPLPLIAQQPALPVIGVLSSASPDSRGSEQFVAFARGLKEAGYVDTVNVRIEYRWASDDYFRLATLAAELVRLRVAVIVAAGGSISAITAHKATKDIPIVFTTVTDPVRSGLVASLNRPGGNATGTAGLTSELDPKRLELLHQLKPKASVIGVLVNPKRPGLKSQWHSLEAAADQLKLKIKAYPAATEAEIDAAFERLFREKVEGLVVSADPFFNSRREQVVALAAKTSLPAIYQWREFVTTGGLMSYGPSLTEAYYQAGINAGRILNGTKPADIPVVQPTRFELVINFKTAKTLGLEISRVLRLRADEVIE